MFQFVGGEEKRRVDIGGDDKMAATSYETNGERTNKSKRMDEQNRLVQSSYYSNVVISASKMRSYLLLLMLAFCFALIARPQFIVECRIQAPNFPNQLQQSARPVLVPVIAATSTTTTTAKEDKQATDGPQTKYPRPKQTVVYSPNNRGPAQSLRSAKRMMNLEKFGIRNNPLDRVGFRAGNWRRRADLGEKSGPESERKRLAWSQPDPRRTYSARLELAAAAAGPTGANSSQSRNSALRRLETAAGEINALASELQDNEDESAAWNNGALVEQTTISTEAKQERLVGGANSARNLQQAAAARKSAQMIALIRYVPVLMHVPAQTGQLLALGSSAGPNSRAPMKQSGNLELAQRQTMAKSLKLAPTRDDHHDFYGYAIGGAANSPTQAKYADLGAAILADSLPGETAPQQQTSELYESNLIHELPAQAGAAFHSNRNNLANAESILGGLASGTTSARLAYVPISHPIALHTGAILSSLPMPGVGGVSQVGGAAYPQQQHNQYQTSAKALGAYASKLISMLRTPASSLLASMSPSQAQPVASGATTSSPGGLYPAGSPGHSHAIYLLAPAHQPDDSVRSPATIVGPRLIAMQNYPLNKATTQAPKLDDLLLNQASKLYSSAQLKDESQLEGRVPFMEENGGFVCLHSTGKGSSNRTANNLDADYPWARARSTNKASHRPASGRPTTGKLGQRKVTDEELMQMPEQVKVDMTTTTSSTTTSSTTSTTMRPAKAAPSVHWGQGARSKINSLETKESPGKLAQKITGRYKAGRQQTRDEADQQRPMAGGESAWGEEEEENSWSLVTNESHHKNNRPTSGAHNPPFGLQSETRSSVAEAGRHERRNRSSPATPVSSSSIIPFTIKDKIDPPGRGSARDKLAPGVAPAAANPANNPVQYDEPAEADQGESVKPLAGGRQARWPEEDQERRVRTSFVANHRGSLALGSSQALGRPPNRPRGQSRSAGVDIDYRKESGNSFSIPLLMASSTRAGADQELQQQQSSRPEPSFARPSFRGRSATPSSGLVPPPPASVAAATAATSLRPVEVTPSGNRRPWSRADVGANQVRQAPETVELIVNSTPEATSTIATITTNWAGETASTLQPTPLPAPATTTTATTTTTASLAADTTATAQPANERVPIDATGARSLATSADYEAAGQHSNHQQETNNNPYSNDKSLSMEEFGQISETLRTNPLDLVDLQNSRSSFELPSQLESLIMLQEPAEFEGQRARQDRDIVTSGLSSDKTRKSIHGTKSSK